MYKTNYSVTIKSISSPDAPTEFTGDAAQAAIAQMTSHRDVDVVFEEGGQKQGTIIPYHDIDSAIIEETRTESEYEDDNAKNCTDGGDSGETGTLTITNSGSYAVTNVLVQLLLDTPATYSGIEFELDGGQTPFIQGTIPRIEGKGSFLLEGIPVGTEYSVPEANEAATGTVPGTAILLDQQ